MDIRPVVSTTQESSLETDAFLLFCATDLTEETVTLESPHVSNWRHQRQNDNTFQAELNNSCF